MRKVDRLQALGACAPALGAADHAIDVPQIEEDPVGGEAYAVVQSVFKDGHGRRNEVSGCGKVVGGAVAAAGRDEGDGGGVAAQGEVDGLAGPEK